MAAHECSCRSFATAACQMPAGMPLWPRHGCHHCTCSLAYLAPDCVNSSPSLADMLASQVKEHTPRSTVRMLRHASAMPSEATLHKPPRKKDRDASSKLKTGVLIENGVEGKSTTPGLPGEHRPLQFTPRSTSAHHLEPHHRVTPPKLTPSPLPTPTALSKDTRHHLGPPKPTHRCLPRGDARQKGASRNKASTMKSHLRKWLNPNMVCLIAWIKCSCAHSLTWDAAIARCHGLCSAPRLDLQYKRVFAKHNLHIPLPEQDCRCVAAVQNPRIVSLSSWEPQGPRARCAITTGVPQTLLSSFLQSRYPRKSHSIDLQMTYPDRKCAPLTPSLRRAAHVRADLRTSRPVPLQGAPAHVCMNPRSAACCSACATRHVSTVCRQCRHNAGRPELNHVCAEGTMPKPSEEPVPCEGEPKARAQQQPRSRFRADAKRRGQPES